MSGPDREILAEAAERAGLGDPITPHVFRHSYGSMLYAATTDPKAVRASCGTRA